MKRFLIFATVLALITACSKNDTTSKQEQKEPVQNDEFHVYSSIADTVILGETNQQYITITPLNNKSADFKLFVTITNQNACLVVNGVKHKNGEVISNLKEGKTFFAIQDITVGKVNLQLKIIDEFKNSTTVEKIVNVVPKLFDFTIGASNTNLDLSQTGSIGVTIDNSKHLPGNTYKVGFSGDGTITYNNKSYSAGSDLFDLSNSGNYTFGYKPSQKGTGVVTISLKDAYNRTISKSITLKIYSNEFEINGYTFPFRALIPGEAGIVGFDINAYGVTGISYQAKIVGNGTFKFDNKIQLPNQYFNLLPNSTMDYGVEFTPSVNTIGKWPIILYVKNQFGLEKSVPLEFNYQNGNLQTTISTDGSGPFSINESIFVLLTVVPNPTTSDKDLLAKFSLKTGTILTVNGLSASSPIPLQTGYTKIYLKLDPARSQAIVDELTVTVTKDKYNTSTATKTLDLTK